MAFASIARPSVPGRARLLIGAAMLGIAGSVAAPVFAQDADTRIRKLEAEVQALQRKVFPGATGRYFEPEITAAAPQPAAPTATSGPVTDLLARMDALEASLAQITARSEVNGNTIALLNARIAALENAAQAAGAPVGTGESPPSPAAPSPPPPPAPAATGSAPTASESNLAAMSDSAAAGEAAPPSPSTGAAAIERPSTGDAGDDAYVYGFRLWEADHYPQAREQLQSFLQQYPSHSRASWGRNLLGRAFLDDGKPREAAEQFLKNYLDNRDGARAPDSLVYLAIATMNLGNKPKACEALEEFALVYPQEAAGRLAALYGDTRSQADCA